MEFSLSLGQQDTNESILLRNYSYVIFNGNYTVHVNSMQIIVILVFLLKKKTVKVAASFLNTF